MKAIPLGDNELNEKLASGEMELISTEEIEEHGLVTILQKYKFTGK